MRFQPEEIETHYCKSAFVQEICVVALTPLHAVVVPDMELMRRRKIVNVGDLLRFEIEGLSHLLPPHQRVIGYEIWFDPLPRTPAQAIDRDEVERRVRGRRSDAPLTEADRAWLAEPHAAAVIPLIQARAQAGARMRPDANLEIDLGLDSMDRVELLTEIEQRFDVSVEQAHAAAIYTVRQLVDTVRSAEASRDSLWSAFAARGSLPPRAASADRTGRSWARVLREFPDLNWLLRTRTVAAPLLWLSIRMVRPLFARVRVSGLDSLPASAPYIICPNHQSYVDPFILNSVLPYRVFKDMFFVGAVEYFETPFARWWARTGNLVPVDPDSNLVPALQAAAFGLTHGKILLLFPEGERSIDGTVKKFKKGAPILAQHLGVPVVPVALKGIYELWPRNHGINWRLVAPWSGHRVSIAIGEPMTLPATATYQDSANQLRSRVNGMWEALST